MGNGEWGMENGEWGMGNGEWGMGNGKLKWEIENGKLIICYINFLYVE